MEKLTTEEIQRVIRAARDSVWVITDELQKLAEGEPADNPRKGNLRRNVDHLKITLANEEIANCGEDISDLYAAISDGESKLAEDIWPADERVAGEK